MPFNIAIVGAGPAGCMLARLLTKYDHKFTITVFEAEDSINFRSQGGTLDLHGSTGQAAMRAAGLWDEFQKYARYDGEALKLADKNLLCYLNMSGSKNGSTKTGRPEIDRPKLREILYNSIPQDIVRWGHKLKSVDQDMTLHFANGATYSGFDLVVGADGAWSKVRQRLTDVQPYFVGIGGFAFSIPNADKEAPEVSKLVNRGTIFGASDGMAINGQQMGDGSINAAAWFLQDRDFPQTCGFDVHDLTAVKADLRKRYADWSPEIFDLVEKSRGEVEFRQFFMVPIGHKWDNVPGATLVGDAAFLITPFAGEGVNKAFKDCIELAEAIVSSVPSEGALSSDSKSRSRSLLHENVRRFEVVMRERSVDIQQLTADNMEYFYFTEGTPRTGIEQMVLRSVSDELGRIMTAVLTPFVYSYFALFKWWHPVKA